MVCLNLDRDALARTVVVDARTFTLMISSKGHEWYTPMELFNKLNAEFGFTTDPCAESTNRLGLPMYFTKEQDGLLQQWQGNVFINPPYGQTGKVQDWVKKASEYMGGLVVFLMPARTDTRWFHNFIWKKPNVEIRFIQGRIKFENPEHVNNTAPFPSMIVVFRNASH